MNTHVYSGHLNSTTSHGTQAPCACETSTASNLLGVPKDCQFVTLCDSTSCFSGYPQGGKGRYQAYSVWAQSLGIRGIRVEPPNCVLAGVAEHFGPSTTGFNRDLPNPCTCDTCSNYVLRATQDDSSTESINSGDSLDKNITSSWEGWTNWTSTWPRA